MTLTAEAHSPPETHEDDAASVARLNAAYNAIREQVHHVIIGQDAVLEQMLIAIFARGHCLLEGVPGLAKTLMVRTVADALSLTFKRIQFTPDLMPADITGTEVIGQNRETGDREFRFLPGPIFGNLILADEINRTPPKTQAALLEAMQERQVTVGGHIHRLGEPFFVLATQNPIEQEGTYPLPEAQLDRFMFNVKVDYPTEDEEFHIVRTTTSDLTPKVDKVLTGTDVVSLQRVVRRVPVPDHVLRYAMRMVRRTRIDKSGAAPKFVTDYIQWGAGPRASQFLVLAGKTRAVLHGRFFVTVEDIRAVAAPVLRHRLLTNFTAESEGVGPDDIVSRLIETQPVEESEALGGGNLPHVLGSGDRR
jgi:MoxR-like ATPase